MKRQKLVLKTQVIRELTGANLRRAQGGVGETNGGSAGCSQVMNSQKTVCPTQVNCAGM